MNINHKHVISIESLLSLQNPVCKKINRKTDVTNTDDERPRGKRSRKRERMREGEERGGGGGRRRRCRLKKGEGRETVFLVVCV